MVFFTADSNVVVPWDFSEHSRKALERAFELTDDPPQVHVVHVAHLPIIVGPGMSPASVDKDALIESSAKKFRDSVANDARFQNVSFTTLVSEEQGLAICDFAADKNADLIVMSSHGRTGFARLMMGSVAERVVRHAPCSVLILRKAA